MRQCRRGLGAGNDGTPATQRRSRHAGASQAGPQRSGKEAGGVWAQLQEAESITVLLGLVSGLGAGSGMSGRGLLPGCGCLLDVDRAACLRPLCVPPASLGTGLFPSLVQESLSLLRTSSHLRNCVPSRWSISTSGGPAIHFLFEKIYLFTLGPHKQHREGPGLGVVLERQLLASATTTATKIRAVSATYTQFTAKLAP